MKIIKIIQISILLAAMILLAAPAYADLISYWKFDDGSGTTVADSAGSNDGTLTDMDPDTDWVTGHTGETGDYALDFDGDDDAVIVPDPVDGSLDNFSNMTISLWFNTAESVIGAKSEFMDKYHWAAEKGYEFWFNSTYGYVQAHLQYASPQHRITDRTEWNVDEWYHLAIVFTGGVSVTGYVNGVHDRTVLTTTASTGDTSEDLFIGRYSGVDDWRFKGLLDDIAIWDQSLDWDQIEYIYEHGVQVFEDMGQVPEPASMMFALAGAVGFIVKRRRS